MLLSPPCCRWDDTIAAAQEASGCQQRRLAAATAFLKPGAGGVAGPRVVAVQADGSDGQTSGAMLKVH